MKKIMLATVAVIAFAGAASAADLSWGGYGEYALEAETFEFGVGADYAIDAVTLSVDVVAIKPNDVALDFDHVDLGVTYAATEQADVYGVVTLDADLEYSETTVGLAFSF